MLAQAIHNMSRPSTAVLSQKASWKANFLAILADPLQEPAAKAVKAFLKRPMGERYSSMKSGTCRMTCRTICCGSCRNAAFAALALIRPFPSMFALLPQPIRIQNKPSRNIASGWPFIIGQLSCSSTCRPCASAVRIFPSQPKRCSSGSMPSMDGTMSWAKTLSIISRPFPGRAMSVSWPIPSNACPWSSVRKRLPCPTQPGSCPIRPSCRTRMSATGISRP